MPENNEIRTPREGAGTAPEETTTGLISFLRS